MHRTLIIGAAGRGVTWVKTVRPHSDFSLSGLADIKPEVLAKVGDEYQIPSEHRHTDYKAALASGDYDVAIIVAPTYLHYPITKDVLNAGLHCLVEKPFTLDMGQAQELVDLADRKKLVLQVVQNYRFNPMCQFVAKFVKDQRLGQLSAIEGAFHRNRPPRYQQEIEMPFPMLFIQGIHHLDFLISMLPSPIVQVKSCHRHPKWSQWKNPSITHVMLECADGVIASYHGSYETTGEKTTFDGFWRFEFEKGDLVIDPAAKIWQITEKGEKKELVFEPKEGEKTGDTCLLDTLHDAITKGIEPPTSGRNNLATLKLLFDVMR